MEYSNKGGKRWWIGLGVAGALVASGARAGSITESATGAGAAANVDITMSATVTNAVKITVTENTVALGATDADSGTLSFGNVDALCAGSAGSGITKTSAAGRCDWTAELSVTSEWAPETTAKTVKVCNEAGTGLTAVSDNLSGALQTVDPATNTCGGGEVSLGGTGTTSPRTDTLTAGVRVTDTDSSGASTTVLVYSIGP